MLYDIRTRTSFKGIINISLASNHGVDMQHRAKCDPRRHHEHQSRVAWEDDRSYSIDNRRLFSTKLIGTPTTGVTLIFVDELEHH